MTRAGFQRTAESQSLAVVTWSASLRCNFGTSASAVIHPWVLAGFSWLNFGGELDEEAFELFAEGVFCCESLSTPSVSAPCKALQALLWLVKKTYRCRFLSMIAIICFSWAEAGAAFGFSGSVFGAFSTTAGVFEVEAGASTSPRCWREASFSGTCFVCGRLVIRDSCSCATPAETLAWLPASIILWRSAYAMVSAGTATSTGPFGSAVLFSISTGLP
jgi:hypothetical protein